MTSKVPEAEFPIIFLDDTSVIQLPVRLTVLQAVALHNSFDQLLQKSSPPQKVVLDLRKTTFIDSSGIGALVSNFKRTRQKGVQLILQNVHPQVVSVLSITGLDQVLTIDSLAPAINSASRKHSHSKFIATHPSVRSRVKRSLDIIGSLVGLAITAVIFIPILIAIKKDSPGPIFFAQTRCGLLGKKFRIWKFRSMCVNAEAMKAQIQNQATGALFKNANDPRVTRVGRFLRRTSLDELPQFWNVLRGEMSLVGTRPPTPDEVERYEVPQWQRLNVKPGMTGKWQVNGRSQVQNFEDVIRLDLRYQKNWSLKYDLKLILKTLLIVFNRNSGAY